MAVQLVYFDSANVIVPSRDGEVRYVAGVGMRARANGNVFTFSPPCVLSFGNQDVAGNTTTRYLGPGWSDTVASLNPPSYRVPSAGKISKMRVRHNITAGNGNAIVYTLRVNGANSALAVSLASTSADGSDLATVVTVAAGDLLDVIVTKAVGVGTSPTNIVATMEIAA